MRHSRSQAIPSQRARERARSDHARAQFSQLTDFSALSSFTGATQALVLRDLSVTSLAGLSSVTSVGALDVSFNQQLTSLDGPDNLTQIGGRLSIYRNPELAECVAEAFAQRFQTSCSCWPGTTPFCTGHCAPHIPCPSCDNPLYLRVLRHLRLHRQR